MDDLWLQKVLLKWSASLFRVPGRVFCMLDDDKIRSLDLAEFVKGLSSAGIVLGRGEAQQIFSLCDKSSSGTTDFEEFLAALRPPVSAAQQQIVADAFHKLDTSGDGLVSVEDLRGVYDARTHPKYQSGAWTEEQVLQAFLDGFDTPGDKDGKVAAEEFLNYDREVSASIDSDDCSVAMMKRAWKL
ncbi:calcyphosin [Emydura macquarii macquarii]|uniref:calcyphosin n=1 Tax=Emydura macquarii macquarii TaxID=1129001 RepID=UPI003529F1C5